ncbi:MAG: adenine phosphoribosyltransferase [Succinivibrio sp.]|nr:adenine phosphoribosyltransferase [Succinivibrio sp.]
MAAQSSDFNDQVEYLKSTVRSIPDYPKAGILFRDITTLCTDPKAFALCNKLLYEEFKDKRIEAVVSAEARGFVFGAPLANALECAFVMVRKPGKLPAKTIEEHYELEYGTSTLQMHEDALKPGQRVLVLDDLVATGGTVDAMLRLVKRLQATPVAAAFIIDLFDLGGVENIRKNWNIEVFSLLKFPGH